MGIIDCCRLVVQRVGFADPSRIPPSVLQAHSSGELSLLPRGGTACLLHRHVPKNYKLVDRPKKVQPQSVFYYPLQSQLRHWLKNELLRGELTSQRSHLKRIQRL